MTNNDYPCEVQELLRDLERVLACVDYNCGCLKKFIDMVYIKLQQKYCGLSEEIKTVKDIIVCAKK